MKLFEIDERLAACVKISDDQAVDARLAKSSTSKLLKLWKWSENRKSRILACGLKI